MFSCRCRTAAILIGILCLLLSLAGCGSDEEETTKAAAEPPEMTAYEKTLTAQPGTLQLDQWKIEVRDLTFTDRIDVSTIISFPAGEGKLYAVISLRVTNEKNEERIFLPALDASGFEYLTEEFRLDGQAVPFSVLVGYDKALKTTEFRPGETREGTLVYSVPRDTADGKQSLELYFRLAEGIDASVPEGKEKDSIHVKFR